MVYIFLYFLDSEIMIWIQQEFINGVHHFYAMPR